MFGTFAARLFAELKKAANSRRVRARFCAVMLSFEAWASVEPDETPETYNKETGPVENPYADDLKARGVEVENDVAEKNIAEQETDIVDADAASVGEDAEISVIDTGETVVESAPTAKTEAETKAETKAEGAEAVEDGEIEIETEVGQ